MFNIIKKNEVLKHLTIMTPRVESETDLDLTDLVEYYNNSTTQNIIEILVDKGIKKEVKIALLTTLNTSLSYSAIANIIKTNDISNLYYLLADINPKPIYSIDELLIITKHTLSNKNKAQNHNEQMVKQTNKKLKNKGVDYTLFNRLQTIDNLKAQGYIPSYNTYIFMRYGMVYSSATTDKYSRFIQTAKDNPTDKFLAIVDGTELDGAYQLVPKLINKAGVKNITFTTLKLLPYLDLDKMGFIDFANKGRV